MAYYLSRNGETSGPYEHSQLRTWYVGGMTDAHVSKSAGGPWTPIAKSPIAKSGPSAGKLALIAGGVVLGTLVLCGAVAAIGVANQPTADTAAAKAEPVEKATEIKGPTEAELETLAEDLAKVPAEPAKAADGSFGNGTHRVGKDIEPGQYRSGGAAGRPCYYSRLRGFSGELKDIIQNEIVMPDQGAAVITIKSTDAGFKSQGCDRWAPLE